jgi:histidyl-tRNA synthetase
VTLQNFLETHSLLPALHSESDAYVVLIGDNMYEKAQRALGELRDMGVNLAVDTTGRKLEKQIKTAVKKNLHYAIFIGDAELANGRYRIRNLVDGTEEEHSAERIVSLIKDRRHSGETSSSSVTEDL